MAEIVAIIIGTIVLLVLINYNHGRAKLKKDYYRRKWREIKILSRSSAAGARLSVIEADKLLGRALEESGVKSGSVGDRLKAAGRRLADKDAVWEAHRLRNRIVHEEIYPKVSEIRKGLKAFEKALKDLGAL